MFPKKEVVAMLLAGGQGSHLGVLTKKLAKPAVNPFTGEIIFDEGTLLNREIAEQIEKAGCYEVELYSNEHGSEETFKVFSNKMADMNALGVVPAGYDLSSLKADEKVQVDVLKEILASTDNEEAFIAEFERRRMELIPKHITHDDIYASVNYMLCIAHG